MNRLGSDYQLEQRPISLSPRPCIWAMIDNIKLYSVLWALVDLQMWQRVGGGAVSGSEGCSWWRWGALGTVCSERSSPRGGCPLLRLRCAHCWQSRRQSCGESTAELHTPMSCNCQIFIKKVCIKPCFSNYNKTKVTSFTRYNYVLFMKTM